MSILAFQIVVKCCSTPAGIGVSIQTQICKWIDRTHRPGYSNSYLDMMMCLMTVNDLTPLSGSIQSGEKYVLSIFTLPPFVNWKKKKKNLAQKKILRA